MHMLCLIAYGESIEASYLIKVYRHLSLRWRRNKIPRLLNNRESREGFASAREQQGVVSLEVVVEKEIMNQNIFISTCRELLLGVD